MALSGGAGAAIALVLALAFLSDRGFAAGMRHRHHSTGVTLLCASQPSSTQPTFYSGMSDANARMHAAMEVPPTGDIDRDFVRMMIPHHQGAIEMARLLLKYGRDQRLRRLAQSIIVEQGQEIAYMRSSVPAPNGEPISHTNPIK